VMARQLAGASFVQEELPAEGARSFLFRGPIGNTRVIWSAKPQSIPLEGDSELRVTDLMGSETRLVAAGGKALLALGTAPVYVRGAARAVRMPP